MRIYLRPITEKDGELIVKWRNSPRVSKHCFDKRTISIESNLAFYNTYIKTEKYYQYIVERVEETSGVISYPIATIYLKDIDKNNCRCELCVFTSDDEEWNTESQSLAVRIALNIAFNELGMHKVYSYIFTEFEDEKNLLESSGFAQEAVLINEARDENGEFVDVLRMATFCDKFLVE